MRILIAGTDRVHNTDVAIAVASQQADVSGKQWTVVSSYLANRNKWSAVSVPTITQVMDAKTAQTKKEFKDDAVIIDQLMAGKVYDNAWIRDVLDKSTHLILVTDTVSNILSPAQIQSFHRVLLTGAVQAVALHQLQSSLAPQVDTASFKNTMSGLVIAREYVEVFPHSPVLSKHSVLAPASSSSPSSSSSSESKAQHESVGAAGYSSDNVVLVIDTVWNQLDADHFRVLKEFHRILQQEPTRLMFKEFQSMFSKENRRLQLNITLPAEHLMIFSSLMMWSIVQMKQQQLIELGGLFF